MDPRWRKGSEKSSLERKAKKNRCNRSGKMRRRIQELQNTTSVTRGEHIQSVQKQRSCEGLRGCAQMARRLRGLLLLKQLAF